MALLHTARAGTAAATSHKRTTARVWRHIANTPDGEVTAASRNERLTWMPAHQSLARALDKTKSNGKSLTMIEWRAKGLAGALAKKAGPRDELIEKVEALVQAAGDTTVHQAGVLGLVTHAADSYKVEATTAKCASKWVTKAM